MSFEIKDDNPKVPVKSKPLAANGFFKVLTSGFGKMFLPQVCSGMLCSFVKDLTVKEVVVHVQNKTSLWAKISPEAQENIRTLAKTTNTDFITVDWAIHEIKGANPALASLCLSWPDARAWLEDQLADLKQNAKN